MAALQSLIVWLASLLPVKIGPVWHRLLTGAGLALAFALEVTGIPGFATLFRLSDQRLAYVVMAITFTINLVHWAQTITPGQPPAVLPPPKAAP